MAQTAPKPIVIDNGSWKCRAGFASPRDTAPTTVFRSVIGKSQQKTLVGDAALSAQDMTITSPVEGGMITNWDAMEMVWTYLFNELKVDSKEHPVLLTERTLNPKTKRETAAQIMFEKFGTPSYFPAYQAVLGLYATGRKDGVMVDSGFGVTSVVPVIEGFAVTDAIQQISLGGQQVTDQLQKLLEEGGKSCQNAAGTNISRDIKENQAFVALDYGNQLRESAKSGDQEYQLPDGTIVKLGSERFRCAEVMFKPSASGYQGEDIHQLVQNAIQKCSESTRQSLYENIAVCGGNSLISGFSDRLTKEITTLAPQGTDVKVISSPERENAVWIGGSILGSLSNFKDMWITKQEYEEHGASVLHKKAP